MGTQRTVKAGTALMRSVLILWYSAYCCCVLSLGGILLMNFMVW